MEDYDAFLAGKQRLAPSVGVELKATALPSDIFPFQRDLVRWSLRKGCAALFASTGLGKTLMQLAWAQQAAERVLILAPLGVARQTVQEGKRWGIPVTYARDEQGSAVVGITITNYEMVDHFPPQRYGAVVLDESSILKSFEGKTRTKLIEWFADTPLRLCCTATPAPNDIAEMANHAEFLGVMKRTEMLATFFVHDDAGWRLKKHAREPFYRWLASWAMSLTRPSDLGYSDAGYELPALEVRAEFLTTDYASPGQLFTTTLKGITERSAVRKATVAERVAATAALVRAEPSEPWLVWCGLNDEGRLLARELPEAVLVEGADDPDAKAARLLGFAAGDPRILITKPTIAGFGMNWQHCARVAFLGLSDSWEQYYQAIRRCWRFGQMRPVQVHVVLSEPERVIWENIQRKEAEAMGMTAELVRHVAEFERAEITTGRVQRDYAPALSMQVPTWLGAS